MDWTENLLNVSALENPSDLSTPTAELDGASIMRFDRGNDFSRKRGFPAAGGCVQCGDKIPGSKDRVNGA